MRYLQNLDVPARLVLVAFLWALCFPLIALAGPSVPPLHLATLRAAIAGGSLIAYAAIMGKLSMRGLHVWRLLLGIGFLATSFGFLGMFRAGEFVSPGIATVINDSQPLIASIMAWRLLSERLTVMGWLGLFLGLAGIVTIASPQLAGAEARFVAAGYAYVVLGATGVAGGNVLMKRLPPTLDPSAAMGWQLLLGSLPLAVVAVLFEARPSITTIVDHSMPLFVLAIFGTALPFAIWFSVLRTQPIGKASAYTFLTSVFGLLIGATFFGERLGWVQIVGVVLTVLGVHLAQRKGRHFVAVR